MKADPQTEADVYAAVMRSFAAFADRDIVAYMRCWVPDEDVIDLGSGADEMAVGRSRIEEFNARYISEMESVAFDVHWHAVSREGPVAWLTAEGAMRVVAEGLEITFSGRLTVIFVLREGAWLMINSHFSVPDARQAPGEAWPTLIDAVASEVRREEPDLAAQSALDGTVTLLFSDIEDSTPMAEQLGDLRWMRVLREHNALVRECVARQSGFEVKTIGDAFMVAFQSARRALVCAVDMQRAFSAYSEEHPEQAVRVRVGLHVGEPVREADDFYGKSVILASRIAGQARGGEILVSSLLRELVESAGDIRFDKGRETTLKGLAGTHRLYAVLQA